MGPGDSCHTDEIEGYVRWKTERRKEKKKGCRRKNEKGGESTFRWVFIRTWKKSDAIKIHNTARFTID